MKRRIVHLIGWVAVIGPVSAVLATGCDARPASADPPAEIEWRRIDSRIHVGCWHGVVLFWSESRGDIAAVPARDVHDSGC